MRRLFAVLVAVAAIAAPAIAPAQVSAAFETSSTASTTITTTTEQVACTLPGVFTPRPSQTVRLAGQVVVSTGASTTSLTFRIRRGSTTSGTQVSSSGSIAAAASTSVLFPWSGDDAPGEIGGQAYVLTVTQGAATTNGTISYCQLQALVF